jgi:hypothetical protein
LPYKSSVDLKIIFIINKSIKSHNHHIKTSIKDDDQNIYTSVDLLKKTFIQKKHINIFKGLCWSNVPFFGMVRSSSPWRHRETAPRRLCGKHLQHRCGTAIAAARTTQLRLTGTGRVYLEMRDPWDTKIWECCHWVMMAYPLVI